MRTGNDINEELVYPNSVVLVQLTGDIEKILALIEKYGVAFSKQELTVFDELPQEIREQEISCSYAELGITTTYLAWQDEQKCLLLHEKARRYS